MLIEKLASVEELDTTLKAPIEGRVALVVEPATAPKLSPSNLKSAPLKPAKVVFESEAAVMSVVAILLFW